MTNCIVCYMTSCKYNCDNACSAAEVEIGYSSDGAGCLTYEEKDIYAEVEGFKRPVECELNNSLFSKPGIPTYKITPVP